MEIGDTFYLKVKPKNYPSLFGKKLTVGIKWEDGSVTPVEEFISVDEKFISKEKPVKLKFSFLNNLFQWANDWVSHGNPSFVH